MPHWWEWRIVQWWWYRQYKRADRRAYRRECAQIRLGAAQRALQREEASYAAAVHDRLDEIAGRISDLLPDGLRLEFEDTEDTDGP